MRIKNLRGRGQLGPIKKKLDSFTLETLKNHLIRNFLRNGRLRVEKQFSIQKTRTILFFFVFLSYMKMFTAEPCANFRKNMCVDTETSIVTDILDSFGFESTKI